MNTLYFTKLILKKTAAASMFVVLSIVKAIFRVLLFFYRIIAIPFIIFSAINCVATLIGGSISEALISLGFVVILAALYYILPATIPMMEKCRVSMYQVMHRPVTYKPRMKYTLG